MKKAAEAFNIITDESIKAAADFEVWEENWAVVDMFLRLQTQWRTSMSGVIGLDYGAVEWVLRLYEVDDQRSMLEDLQVMEGAALALINKKEG